jgi:hypothetical protein
MEVDCEDRHLHEDELLVEDHEDHAGFAREKYGRERTSRNDI